MSVFLTFPGRACKHGVFFDTLKHKTARPAASEPPAGYRASLRKAQPLGTKPPGYIIALDNAAKTELVKIFDRFDPLKHSSVPPSAFTEKGLYMMATILKSSKATQTTISIIETFAKLRELSKAINQLPDARDKSAQKSLMQKSGEILAEILDENSMETTGDETSIEINLAVMKIKRTIKREKKKN